MGGGIEWEDVVWGELNVSEVMVVEWFSFVVMVLIIRMVRIVMVVIEKGDVDMVVKKGKEFWISFWDYGLV